MTDPISQKKAFHHIEAALASLIVARKFMGEEITGQTEEADHVIERLGILCQSEMLTSLLKPRVVATPELCIRCVGRGTIYDPAALETCCPNCQGTGLRL